MTEGVSSMHTVVNILSSTRMCLLSLKCAAVLVAGCYKQQHAFI